jgi:glycosyltransferase involved in cell wall biosynthesis
MGCVVSRVGLFLPSLAGGGAQRVFLLLAKGMHAKACDVDIVVPNARGPLETEIPTGVRLVSLGAPRVAQALPPLVRYLRHERPVALVSAMTHGNVVAIGAVRLSGAPTRAVVTEHQHLTTFVAHAPAWRDRRLPRLVRLTYRHADHVVAVSHGVAADLARHARLPRDRIEVIYNPVPVDELRLRAEADPGPEWARAGGVPFILGVGRLSDQKDFATLIRAFARLSQRTESRLVILGDGPLRPSLDALIRKHGLQDRVQLPGFVTNPYAWMKRARVLALSSRWEGLPTVLLEAMALDTPIVSTDCPSGPRELLADGAFGALVPPGDPAKLAEALDAALHGPVHGDRRPLIEQLTVERIAARYLALATRERPRQQDEDGALEPEEAICAESSV